MCVRVCACVAIYISTDLDLNTEKFVTISVDV